MKVDLEIFKELREAIQFKGTDKEFVYSLGIEFDGMQWVDLTPLEISNIMYKHDYEWADGEDYQEYCWGVFKFKEKYYKVNWEYCKVACELDYWRILEEENFYEVKPVEVSTIDWVKVDA